MCYQWGVICIWGSLANFIPPKIISLILIEFEGKEKEFNATVRAKKADYHIFFSGTVKVDNNCGGVDLKNAPTYFFVLLNKCNQIKGWTCLSFYLGDINVSKIFLHIFATNLAVSIWWIGCIKQHIFNIVKTIREHFKNKIEVWLYEQVKFNNEWELLFHLPGYDFFVVLFEGEKNGR